MRASVDCAAVEVATPSGQDPAPRRSRSRIDFGRRTMRWHGAGISLRVDARTVAVCVVLMAGTAATGLICLASGDYELTASQVISAIAGGDDDFARTVVIDWRMPRVLAAIVFGAGLGLSGAIFQSLTRNPLASPDVIGFSTGSYTGALVVIAVLGGSYVQVAFGALVGGICTAAAVYLLAYKRGVQGFRLIVVGIAVAAMLSSVNTWILLTTDLQAAMTGAVWGAGSLNSTSWTQALIGAVTIGLLLCILIPLSRPLRQLQMGDDAARALGVRTEPARLALVIVGVGLIATVTAAAGPIAFVALCAPQIGARLARSAGVALAPAAFTGALLLCVADYTAQHLLPSPLPVGVITVVFGGAYLIWLLIRETRRRTM